MWRAGWRPTARQLICVAGYHRNMADFADFVPLFHQLLRSDWPVVLVDLRGRGRSADRARAEDYTTTNDASDLAIVTTAIGAESAIFIGQGHGGQAVMALAAARPLLVAGAVLVDAGPVTSPPSLVRLRTNLTQIEAMRGLGGLRTMLRRMLSAEYPEASADALDRLIARTHALEGNRARPLFDTALDRPARRLRLRRRAGPAMAIVRCAEGRAADVPQNPVHRPAAPRRTGRNDAPPSGRHQSRNQRRRLACPARPQRRSRRRRRFRPAGRRA